MQSTQVGTEVDQSIDDEDSWAPKNPMYASRDIPRIGRKEEVEPEDVFNDYLLSGYRINYNSWKQILSSLFEWHNETVNIWTHLLGFIVFTILLMVLGLTNMGEGVYRHPLKAIQGMQSFASQPSEWDFGLIKS